MCKNELKKIIDQNKEISELLEKRRSLEKQKGNAEKHLSEARSKEDVLTAELKKIRGEMKKAILEGRDPEALHQEEVRIAASIQSASHWIEEVSEEILPGLTEEIKPVLESLKREIERVVTRYRRDMEVDFSRQLDDLGNGIIVVEEGIREVGRELGINVVYDTMIHLSSKEIMHRIRPF